jgi:hypothetical protein
MGTEGLTDEQYIQQLREAVEQQRQRIAELEARVTQAETQVSAHRTQARAEGFRATKERAAALANDAFEEAKARRKACNLTAPMGQAMHRISEGQEDVLGTLSDDIRAMEDAGEGGLPPLSQLRAATERMEAAAKPSPIAILGEAVDLLARVVQLAQMGGASGLLVSFCQLALHNMRVEKREAESREGQG